jgi:NAD-dependent DNA ligase
MDHKLPFTKVLEQLENLMYKKGEPFRARAYQKAKEALILHKEPIINKEDLNGIRGIGKTIIAKFEEFKETGTLQSLEKEKENPMFIFTNVYGIGPKKAKELVKKHKITSIKELRERQNELLNDVQKKGLKYYEDVLERIPRSEIETYDQILHQIFDTVKNSDESNLQIVGSYRRGKQDSGDIDIIISDKHNDEKVFIKFIDELIKHNLLIEVLSRGSVKCLGVSKLEGKTARRIDFMFTSKKEFAFAILYFTGSKEFNTVMRQRALDLGYSMNEHCFTKMVDGKKTTKLDKYFPDEQSIFKFLGMIYKEPEERIGGNAFELISETIKKSSKRKKSTKKTTLKKKNSIKHYINEYKKYGQPILEALVEPDLSAVIRYSNKKYYCNNKSVMTDEQYDILKEFIEEKYPDNEAIKEGHTQCSVSVEKKKSKLPYEMWSMDKIKPDSNAVINWLKKYNGPFVLSAKLDGISVLYTTEGDEPKMYTRGNGKVGQDISHAIQYLNLPIQKDITIRGELIMTKEKFKENWSDKFGNARNMIAGTANAKESFPERWTDIDFVAYEVIQPELIPSKQLKLLKKLMGDEHTVICKKKTKISNEILSQYLTDWRENYKYDIDGVIVVDNHQYPRTSKNPKHAFAFKMVLSDQIVESKVVDVIWTPSKTGYLKPRIQIQPVKIGGATITYATAHNADFIIKNKIGIGTVIQLIRSGDVIPKVESVIKPSEQPKLPDEDIEYQWNSTKKDFVLTNFGDNEIVNLKKIEDFFRKIDVVGLGRGNVKRIMNTGFNTIPKIINMSIDDFITVEGFKQKMATKVHNSIKEKLEAASIEELMNASNIFQRGLGKRRVIQIFKKYPTILVTNETDDEKMQKIIRLEGFKNKTAEMFVPFIDNFKEFMKTIHLEHKLEVQYKKEKNTSHPLYEKKIVMTGFRDKELSSILEEIGAELSSSVSNKTYLVVVKDIDDDTGKADKARKLNIPMIEVKNFKEKFHFS